MTPIRQLWPFVQPHKRALLAGGSLAAAEVIVGLAQPWPLKFVVDSVLIATPRPHDATTIITLACVSLVIIVGLTAVLDYWSTRILSSTGLRLANQLRETVFAHLNRLSLRFHGSNRVGDLSSRVTGDVDRSQDMIVQVLAVMMPNGLLLIGMVTIMFLLDATFAFIALALTPLLGYVVSRSTKQLRKASRTRSCRRRPGCCRCE